MKKVDYLVIGSGIAGLTYSIKLAQHFLKEKKNVDIYVLSKVSEDETGTKYAQGGVAGVFDKNHDSFEKHIEDTLVCGDGLCNKNIVEIVVKEGPGMIEEIINWGTNFDKNNLGDYDLAKEGGHSENRIIHHKDITGWEIERALLEKVKQYKSIEILSHFFAIDLITEHHLGKELKRNESITCFGVYALDRNSKKIETILAKSTLLAAGGAGNIYQSTTNPVISTGDGVAMAYRAKAEIENMEFFQFHPTSLYNPDERPSFLISEAVRGFGGILKSRNNKEFMISYDERKSLAPRDITARAIDSELKMKGGDYVYLDVRETDLNKFKDHFPNITEKCKSIGIDIATDMIPVVPAAHYMCGGIKVDENSRTSISRLYACGECSSTGLHGANRLASNSLLEALVFANRSFYFSVSEIDNDWNVAVPNWNMEGTTHPKEWLIIDQAKKELQEIMSKYVGIVRSNSRLKKAKSRVNLLFKETQDEFAEHIPSRSVLELRNMINVAHLIIEQAIKRKENKGLHYNIDNFTS